MSNRESEIKNESDQTTGEATSCSASGEPGASAGSVRMITDGETDVKKWTEADVQSWLTRIGCGQFADKFKDIDGEKLFKLDRDGLKELGIPTLSGVKKMEEAIDELVGERISDGTTTLPADVEEWTKADVQSWLTSIGCDQFADKFNNIDGKELLTLNRDDRLKELGISALNDLIKVQEAIEELDVIGLKFEVTVLVKKLRKIMPTPALKVLEGCWLPGKKMKANAVGVYCRREYDELFKVISEENDMDNVFTIEGVPGIGKTMMIPFVVWKLLHADPSHRPPRIVLSLMNAKSHMFKIDPSTGSVSLMKFRHVKNGDWILHDGPANDNIGHLATNAKGKTKVLVFISARRDHRDKSCLSPYQSRKIMSPFDQDELLDLYENVYSDFGDKDSVLTGYEKIGGVPRFIFEQPAAIQGIFEKIETRLSPDDVLNDSGELEASCVHGRGEQVTFKAVQPWWGGDKRHSFLLAEIRFSSQKIADRVTDQWNEEQWKKLVQGAFKPGKEKGHLFEIACHNLIPKKRANQPGVSFEDVTILNYDHKNNLWKRGDRKEGGIQLPRCTERRIKGQSLIDLFGYLERLKTFQAVYGKPSSKIFKTIDSVILTKNEKSITEGDGELECKRKEEHSAAPTAQPQQAAAGTPQTERTSDEPSAAGSGKKSGSEVFQTQGSYSEVVSSSISPSSPHSNKNQPMGARREKGGPFSSSSSSSSLSSAVNASSLSSQEKSTVLQSAASSVSPTDTAPPNETSLENPLTFIQYTTADDHSLLMYAVNNLWEEVRKYYRSGEEEYVYPVFYFIVPSFRREFMPSPPKFSEDTKKRKEEELLFTNISFFIIEISHDMLTGQIPYRIDNPNADQGAAAIDEPDANQVAAPTRVPDANQVAAPTRVGKKRARAPDVTLDLRQWKEAKTNGTLNQKTRRQLKELLELAGKPVSGKKN